MTVMGLNWLDKQETARANLAKEQENYRANRAKELENYRSNTAKERETKRSNLANEELTERKLIEQRRSNLENERLTAERNAVQDRVESKNADTRANEAFTNRYNSLTRASELAWDKQKYGSEKDIRTNARDPAFWGSVAKNNLDSFVGDWLRFGASVAGSASKFAVK